MPDTLTELVVLNARFLDLQLESRYYMHQMRASLGTPTYDYWADKMDTVIAEISAVQEQLKRPPVETLRLPTWYERISAWFNRIGLVSW